MQWTGKLLGGALGALLGPLGVAVGAALGHQYDVNSGAARAPDAGQQFFRATFLVMGHVAKADGRVTEREIEAARSVMQSLRLNELQVREAISLFSAGKRPDFDLDDELAKLRAACRAQPEVLRVFIEIQLRAALAGNDMTGPTRLRVTRIASLLGIAPPLLGRLEAAMRGSSRPTSSAGHAAQSSDQAIAQAYRTLEIDASATDAELTKAYRRQMSRHHPDKLKANGLPESMVEHAKQRTQAIRESYELLRARRGTGT
jgi:DnaJ like chaperone protein